MRTDEELIERAIEIGVQFEHELDYRHDNPESPDVFGEVISAVIAASALTGHSLYAVLRTIQLTAPDAGESLRMTRIVRHAVRTHE